MFLLFFAGDMILEMAWSTQPLLSVLSGGPPTAAPIREYDGDEDRGLPIQWTAGFSIKSHNDSSLFLSGNKPVDLISEMHNEIKYITQWLSTNKLLSKIGKYYMSFKSKGKSS